MAAIASGDIEGAIKEIERCAKLGFRGLSLPCNQFGVRRTTRILTITCLISIRFGRVSKMWIRLITDHVSTGRDPRTSRGNGGAVINYAVHSLAPTMEPIANLCASGVLDRFPKLIFGSIEAGIGWVAWTWQALLMRLIKKHHMFVRPKLKLLPSEYLRQNGFASFQEDKVGSDLARDMISLITLWANDYPHHEGTWPHSPQAIERTMGMLNEEERTKILGLNSARTFKFPIPEQYLG